MSEFWLIVAVSAAVPVVLLLGPYVPFLIMEWLDNRGGGGEEFQKFADEFVKNYHAGLQQGLRSRSDAGA